MAITDPNSVRRRKARFSAQGAVVFVMLYAYRYSQSLAWEHTSQLLRGRTSDSDCFARSASTA